VEFRGAGFVDARTSPQGVSFYYSDFSLRNSHAGRGTYAGVPQERKDDELSSVQIPFVEKSINGDSRQAVGTWDA